MEALTSALLGGPSTADYAFLQEMCQRPNEEGELERGAPAPAAARPSAFPHFGKKIERQAAPPRSCLFFLCRRILQLCRGVQKSVSDRKSMEIPFDTVKARPANCAKGGIEEGRRMSARTSWNCNYPILFAAETGRKSEL